MSKLRAIIVALLTLAVAALPVASVSASVVASDAAPAAAQADCAKHLQASRAEHDQANDQHAKAAQPKGHCADHAACGGKCLCLGLTAVLPPASATLSSLLPRPATARVAAGLNGPAYIPPSPPPRV
jgi:hypothetical protein